MSNLIWYGDCREVLRTFAAMGLQANTCVTSPPYFGLRDYGHDGQIGLEQTPESYIANLVEVFRCVRDVLRDDGTLWVNLGDSYNASPGQRKVTDKAGTKQRTNAGAPGAPSRSVEGLKPKDLIGIPWRVAFALQADGWYLRQEIIWAKPNPMPESVKDRCTKSHEQIFLLSKSAKYYFDHEAIKEPAVCGRMRGPAEHPDKKSTNGNAGLSRREPEETRNKRDVWTVATRPFKGAHFATFPPELIEPCILAGSPLGGVVLDPFMGSGTTAAVAKQHCRQYLGCELNPEYRTLIEERLK